MRLTPGPSLEEGTTGMVNPVDLDIYNEQVKEYMKQHSRLQTHNQQLYAIIWGQATEMVCVSNPVLVSRQYKHNRMELGYSTHFKIL